MKIKMFFFIILHTLQPTVYHYLLEKKVKTIIFFSKSSISVSELEEP